MRRAGALALALLPGLAHGSAADLHAHLLMDASVPGVFRGHAGHGAKAKDRRDRFRNQIQLKDLEAADVRLLAATMYTPAVWSQLRGGYTRSLNKQLDALDAWVRTDPRVSIVRTPEEAEAVVRAPDWRLGVIVAVEGAGGADTPAKLDKLWDRGLRLITVAHFADTAWGGAADVRYWPRPSCKPGGTDSGKRNRLGVAKKGQALMDYAVAKGFLLDLTHSSDNTVLDVARRFPALPLLFTHQASRDITPCERTISDELLREVKRSHGMVGLTVSSNYIGEDVAALLKHATIFAREAGPEAVALGTDFNGTITRVEGVPDSSGLPLLIAELKKNGIPADHSAEAFVAYWTRAWAARGSESNERR
jgi:microsomal dipeptidase-like Zn-dependent dipeptidase